MVQCKFGSFGETAFSVYCFINMHINLTHPDPDIGVPSLSILRKYPSPCGIVFVVIFPIFFLNSTSENSGKSGSFCRCFTHKLF